jgi:hypothetical protein
LTVPDAEVDPTELEVVLATYKQRYQRTPAEAEAAIATLASSVAPAPAQQTSPPAYSTLFQQPSSGGKMSN